MQLSVLLFLVFSQVYGESSLKLVNLFHRYIVNYVRYRWHEKFKGGKTDLKDEPHPSQPRKAATKANAAAVADMVKQDARFTVKEIADSVGVSSGTVHKILTQELKLRKVYRHGDRSPVVLFPTDPNKADKWPQGFGWLSKVGMQEHYSLGKFLRRRYVDTGFLSKAYNHTEIKIDSSDVDRCLMSSYCNLAGLFPPTMDQQFNASIFWQPIPVHTRPEAEDNTLNLGEKCPRYREAVEKVYKSPEVQKEEQQNKGFYEWLGNKTGLKHLNISNVWKISDTLFCEKQHNLTLASWAKNETVYKKLRRLLDYHFELMFKTIEMSRLKGGPLLSEFIDNMKNKAKKDAQTPESLEGDNPALVKMFMYSAHDTTVAALLSALQVYNKLSPPYASMVIMELHQDSGGKYYVQIYYKNTTDSDIMVSLTIPNCAAKCPFDTFISLTKPVIPVDWLKECGLRPQPSSSSSSWFSTDKIVVVVLVVLSTILILVNVIMFFKLKRNRQGYTRGKI